jgi:hypothetical protein
VTIAERRTRAELLQQVLDPEVAGSGRLEASPGREASRGDRRGLEGRMAMADPFLQQELALADQEIAEAEELVAHQVEIIKCLEADGQDSTKAEDQLRVMEETLGTLREHREAILQEIAAEEDDPG